MSALLITSFSVYLALQTPRKLQLPLSSCTALHMLVTCYYFNVLCLSVALISSVSALFNSILLYVSWHTIAVLIGAAVVELQRLCSAIHRIILDFLKFVAVCLLNNLFRASF